MENKKQKYICIISIILMITTILLDLRRGLVQEYPFVSVGLIFLLLFSTISTIREIYDTVLGADGKQATGGRCVWKRFGLFVYTGAKDYEP